MPTTPGPGPEVVTPGRPTGEPAQDGPAHRRRRGGSATAGQNVGGWLFVSPALAILLLFLVVPIGLAVYVSFTDWSGVTSPFGSTVHTVGLSNYASLVSRPGLSQQLFGT